MTNANDARKAHKILDDLLKGKMVLEEEREFLRSALPELPKQKTLEEIAELVNEAWGDTNVNEWDDDALGHLESWLSDLEMQLRGLANTKPAHPEFLETEEDYANAPEGTVVACDNSPAWHKFGSEWVSIITYANQCENFMAGTHRFVLRWGWGND